MSELATINSEMPRGSSEIDKLYSNSLVQGRSSLELGWKDFIVERRDIRQGEITETASDCSYIILWNTHSSYGERADRGGNRFLPYAKHPGTLSLSGPGVFPPVRVFTNSEVVICALRAKLMHEIDEELGLRLVSSSQELLGIRDSTLRQLVLLLAAEVAAGGPNGVLYAESLAHAAAIRFLSLTRNATWSNPSSESALPSRLVARIVDYMKTHFHTNVDLATLASESGYSRAHFLRMFRTATGKTPHQFLLDLRLEEARLRIVNSSDPLVSVAMACGFSSQSHLSTAFARRFGVAPGEYRRKI